MIFDPVTAFSQAAADAGIPMSAYPIADGELHRYKTEGDKKENSWYVLYSDGFPAGAYGCHKRGFKENWHSTQANELSADERHQLQKDRDHKRAERAANKERTRAEARLRATDILRQSVELPNSGTEPHPYLSEKKIGPHGIYLRGNSLVIPIRNSSKELTSLQFISNGNKKFLTGGEITGCYHAIGDKPTDRLLVTEGYATGSTLHEATGDTVAIAFSANNLKPVAGVLREKFPNLKIILCADNDTQTEGNPGVRKATEAAQEIGGLLAIPNCEGDFNDIAINKGLEIVQQIVDAAMEPPQSNEAAKGNGKEPINEESPRHSQATTLVEMSLQKYEFGISTTGETFAISKTGPRLVAMLRGSRTSLRGQLAKEYFREYHRAASQQALADALLVIDGIAQEANERELYLRVASHNNDLWVDMCDLTGRAIKITPQGWSIESQPPMLFRRTALNGVLPEPESGGSLDDLWSLLNVTEPDRPLIIAWLIAALFPDMPHPVLSFFGEQGTGKTTAHKMLVTAIDPGPVPIRKPPRDSESWVTAAAGSWFVGIDNLSEVPPWLSDSICRAVTGEGDVRRKLYTDGEHHVFSFRRCICLNGIDLGATRGDLAQRMLPIMLDRISETARRSEDDIWSQWEQRHARIFGAILDLAVQVISDMPFVELTSKPRMADFAKILATVDKILGTAGLSHYIDVLAGLSADSLTGDCFILAVMELTDSFKGTSAGLLAKVTPEKPPRSWPKNPRAVTTRLKRHAPALRDMGWTVDNDGGYSKSNTLEWTLIPPEKACNSSSSSSPTRQKGKKASVASVASQEYGPSQDVDTADLQAIGETDGDIEQFREDEAEYLSERGIEEAVV